MTTSIISGMSNADYHAHPAVSKSGLDKINRSVAHFLLPPKKDELNTEKAMPALEFGTAVHTEVLEGKLDSEYCIAPTCKRQKNVDKATWAEYFDYLKQSGLKKITQEDYNKIKAIDKAVKEHPLAGNMFRDKRGQAEVSFFWKEKGIPARCRPDWIIPDETPVRNRCVVIDLKTTDNAKPESFQSSIRRWRYHVQAGWYCRGIQQCLETPTEWMFVTVEKQAPYNVAIYTLSDADIKKGLDEGIEDLLKLKDYYDSPEGGRWAGYPPIVQEIALPE